MMGVRWEMPGSRFHGVVHFVSAHLVDELGDGRVVVWWPNRKRGKAVGGKAS